MTVSPSIACARCGAPCPGGACLRHPAAGSLDLRRADDQALALQLRDRTRARRERLAAVMAALGSVAGGVGLLVQSTAPWGAAGPPPGWMAGGAVALAAVLVSAALGIRREAAAPTPPAASLHGFGAADADATALAVRLRHARWLRLAGHASALISAPYALVGVMALIADPAAASLAAVAHAIPFLLGLTLLEAARRVEEGPGASDEGVEEDSWLGAAPPAGSLAARPALPSALRSRTPRRAAG